MKSIVVANWKMNPASLRDAKKLLESTRKVAEVAKNVSIVVAPPSLYLRELRAAYKGKRLSFAAQNAHFESEGSFTGETSLPQIRDARVTHVLVGHAERRAMGETDEDVKKKVHAALDAKFTPILCIGETSRSSGGEHYVYVRQQLSGALRDITPTKLASIMIAYEPVWAIGKDTSMGAREMHEMTIFIRKTIVDMHNGAGMNIKILYGGSVDEKNAADMLINGDVNGLLVGRVSTQAARFASLISVLADL